MENTPHYGCHTMKHKVACQICQILAYDIQIKLSIHLNFSFTTQNENENTTQEAWKSNLSYCDDLTFYS